MSKTAFDESIEFCRNPAAWIFKLMNDLEAVIELEPTRPRKQRKKRNVPKKP